MTGNQHIKLHPCQCQPAKISMLGPPLPPLMEHPGKQGMHLPQGSRSTHGHAPHQHATSPLHSQCSANASCSRNVLLQMQVDRSAQGPVRPAQMPHAAVVSKVLCLPTGCTGRTLPPPPTATALSPPPAPLCHPKSSCSSCCCVLLLVSVSSQLHLHAAGDHRRTTATTAS